ncbi:MAG TPA: hypothetical protein PLC52_01935 [Anaerolineales bacterium]|nr:hypothetical protein [Anaerolineales bacterium]HRQ91613.1 hypothetical protein [Anaerolineales bacterium]
MGERAIVVICLTLFLAVGILAVLYAGARRGSAIGQIEIARRIIKGARSPFKTEDEKMEELAKKVEELRKQDE